MGSDLITFNISAGDNPNVDTFWLKESPEDSANLPDPDIIAAEIVEDLQAVIESLNTNELEPFG